MRLMVAVPELQQLVILVVEEFLSVQILRVSVAIDNVPAVLMPLPGKKHIRTRGYRQIAIKDVLLAPKMVQIGTTDGCNRWMARGGVAYRDGSIPPSRSWSWEKPLRPRERVSSLSPCSGPLPSVPAPSPASVLMAPRHYIHKSPNRTRTASGSREYSARI